MKTETAIWTLIPIDRQKPATLLFMKKNHEVVFTIIVSEVVIKSFRGE